MTSKGKKVFGKSPARTRMIAVMTTKGLSPRTQEHCLESVCGLARHWGRALSADEVRSWVMERIGRGLSPRTTNVDISALRLFFADAMGRPDKVEGLRALGRSRPAPSSFSPASGAKCALSNVPSGSDQG